MTTPITIHLNRALYQQLVRHAKKRGRDVQTAVNGMIISALLAESLNTPSRPKRAEAGETHNRSERRGSMSRGRYILNEAGEPVACPALREWAAWMKTHSRVVGKAQVGDSGVSTVFLGLDHSFSGGPPLLWETMVFGGAMDQEQERCSGSRKEALAMHERMVAKVKETQPA